MALTRVVFFLYDSEFIDMLDHTVLIWFQYLFSLLVLLVAECVLAVLAVLCPQYLGLTIDREDVQDNWQRTYGVPGREQYTAAIDLAQTKVLYQPNRLRLQDTVRNAEQPFSCPVVNKKPLGPKTPKGR